MDVKREEDNLSESEIHSILSNTRRQTALFYLYDRGGATDLRELSEFIASLETDESPAPRNKRNSVYSSLHQNHLPRLDGLGVIEYDKSRKTIELGGAASELRPHLERHVLKSKFRSIAYIGFGILGVTMITATFLDLFPFSIFDPLGVLIGFLVLSGFLISLEIYRIRARLSV